MASLGLGLLILAACWGLGALLHAVGWVRLPGIAREESPLDAPWRVVLGTGVGMAVGGMLVLAAGSVVLPPAWLAWAVTLGLAGAGLWLAPWRAMVPRREPLLLLTLIAGLGIIGFHVMMALVPELDIDELTYHLNAPKAWQLAGRMRQLPFEPLSEFHFLSQMMSLWSLVLAPLDLFAPRLVELGRAVLAALAVGLVVARRANSWLGLVAALLLLLHEEIARFAVTAQIDAGQSLYAVLGVAVLGRWLEEPTDRRLALLGSALLGCVLAVKNVGWFYMGAGLFAAGVLRIAQCHAARDWRSIGIDAAVVGCGWLLTAGPWILRAAINTGNPIYPFMSHILPVREAIAPAFHWITVFYPPPDAATRWWDYLPDLGQLYVVRSNVRLTNAHGALMWSLLAIVLLMLARRRGAAVPIAVWMLVLPSALLLPVQFKTPFSRFFISSSFAALAGGIIALGIVVLPHHRRWLAAALAALLLIASNRALDVHRSNHPGLRSVDAWPDQTPPLTHEARLRWLEANDPAGIEALALLKDLPAGSYPVVSVTSPAVLLTERPYQPNVVCVIQEVVSSLARQGWTPAQIHERLHREGITHIVTTTDYAADPRTRAYAVEFLEPIATTPHRVALYRLRDP